MHIHILGICGTFMGGIAQLARALGHTVSGSDQNVYPPMSTQLEQAGIQLIEGYDEQQLDCEPDQIVVGNVMARGNPTIEAILNKGLPYISGPQWLSENLLQDKWVIAVSGTHGKTTTTSLVAWLLESAGLNPGFLVGGVPENFGVSARLTDSPFFVIEADEYDTAFFDKRSKFVHYKPRTLIINNLEYDHADIFPDLEAIKRQFHHLVRIVPEQGLIVCNGDDENIKSVLEMGCWTPQMYFADDKATTEGLDWQAAAVSEAGSEFDVLCQTKNVGRVQWDLFGRHNIQNALAALLAARHVGVPIEQSIESLKAFKGIKRRLEVKGSVNGITIYDDFAHHPTAIKMTLQGLRERVGQERIIAILEPRSNTMRMGVHKDTLLEALGDADESWLCQADDIFWSLRNPSQNKIEVRNSVDAIIKDVLKVLKSGDHVLIMSNGGFDNLHTKLLDCLSDDT